MDDTPEVKNNNEMRLPPVWCSRLCQNAMGEVCVEHCSSKQDCSYLEPTPGMLLEDMPRFPLGEMKEMTIKESFTLVSLYLAKVVDHLKGIEDEQPRYTFPIRRPYPNSSGSRRLPKDFQVKDLLSGVSEGDPTHQDREECAD